ncbi:MAG: helix-turn-helix domain-containing protein [Clostridia bacterium]|nr:helix-turn-helix domain-containing protein [Clostridia bacterium]
MEYISRIKELKSKQKITSDKLAELTGIPKGTLTKILSGVSDSVKLSNIVAIADVLGVSLDYLVLGKGSPEAAYSLSASERALLDGYRNLDDRGRTLVDTIISKEAEQNNASRGTVLSSPITRSAGVARTRRSIPIYDLPVSAGPGEYLDYDNPSDTISIPVEPRTEGASFAVRISGRSMEPKFHDKDIILVENTETVEPGDLCVYVLDGCSYFKVFGGDCLISLNPEFGKIMLSDYESVSCSGRVIGRLRKSVVR